MHFVRDCPFSDHTCKLSNRVDHKEGYCSCITKAPSNSSKERSSTEEKRKPFKKQQLAKSRGIFVVNHIATKSRKRKFVPININGVITQLQLYTGSDITVVSEATWRKLGEPGVQPTSIQAVNASGESLWLVGKFLCDVTLNGRTEQSRFFVTSTPGLNLLGIEWIELFELWSIPIDAICNIVEVKSAEKQLQELRADHAQVFDDSLGHCTETKVKLFLKPNAKPVYCPNAQFRSTPYRWSTTSSHAYSLWGSSHRSISRSSDCCGTQAKRTSSHLRVFAQVHRAVGSSHSWQWEAATVIEKIGKVNYNVFLENSRRLIRTHTNQLKNRVPDVDSPPHPTSLTISFDGFGVTIPAAPVEAPEPVEPAAPPKPDDQSDSEFSDDEFEDWSQQDELGTLDGEPEVEQFDQPPGRTRRMIQRPGRFKSYWMA